MKANDIIKFPEHIFNIQLDKNKTVVGYLYKNKTIKGVHVKSSEVYVAPRSKYANVDTTGFVIDKIISDKSVRVHDPRGFKVVVPISDILTSITVSGCDKKKLSGYFRYGWNDGNIRLIDINSPLYQQNLMVCPGSEFLEVGSLYKFPDSDKEVTYIGTYKMCRLKPIGYLRYQSSASTRFAPKDVDVFVNDSGEIVYNQNVYNQNKKPLVKLQKSIDEQTFKQLKEQTEEKLYGHIILNPTGKYAPNRFYISTGAGYVEEVNDSDKLDPNEYLYCIALKSNPDTLFVFYPTKRAVNISNVRCIQLKVNHSHITAKLKQVNLTENIEDYKIYRVSKELPYIKMLLAAIWIEDNLANQFNLYSIGNCLVQYFDCF